MSYDDAYKKIPDYFGTEPSPLLVEYCHLLNKPGPVLDIGAGQGRNSLFLAQKGYTVDAVEPSQVGVDTINRIASESNQPIRAYCTDFEDFVPPETPFGAVLLFGIIQMLEWESINLLIEKIQAWTAPGSHILISAFTTDDPGFGRIAATSEKVGKNSYRMEGGTCRTFLEPDEVLNLFSGLETIHHWEGMGPSHTHGGKEPHRHAVAHTVFCY